MRGLGLHRGQGVLSGSRLAAAAAAAASSPETTAATGAGGSGGAGGRMVALAAAGAGVGGGVGTVCAAKVVAGAGPSRLVYAVHLHCVCTKKEASLPAQGDTSSCSQTENVHTKPESRSKDSKERVLHRRRCTSRQPWMIETGKHAVVQLLASRHSERRRFECALF